MRNSPESEDAAGGLLAARQVRTLGFPGCLPSQTHGEMKTAVGWVSSSLQMWKHLVIGSQEEDSSILS